MNSIIDKTEIGSRILHLRNTKGISQEELAQKIDISRSALSQIENGNRNIQLVELKSLSEILNFSMDEIMSNDFSFNLKDVATETSTDNEIRISVPEINMEKFKNLILYILERCAGKPNVGETVLYKLLYFSDFNYYEIYEEHLSGAMYRKLPRGPVPKDVDQILKKMVDNSVLKSFNTDYFGHKQKRYIPLVNADVKLFNGAEIEVVDRVVDLLSGMNANDISHYSHQDMPWKASKDMGQIDYELVFYREAPYSVRTYNDSECYDQD